MYDSIKASLNTWNTKTNDRQKLQQLYLAIIVVGIIVAGVTSLLNPEIGHNLVLVAIFAIVVFISNAVVWNLLKAGLLSNLSTKSRRK